MLHSTRKFILMPLFIANLPPHPRSHRISVKPIHILHSINIHPINIHFIAILPFNYEFILFFGVSVCVVCVSMC